ncbi:MAG TPA: glycosyltransferase family 2 protein [Candidatus Acidoferrales bacterium]|nr:glycosyltransferase family 2 protein [Candidatus Acidoferrales bacterium]
MNSSSPKISVVIASIVGTPFIDECVASVLAQKGAPEFEVIVVDCRGAENVARLKQKFPQVRFVEQAQRETVPKLRRIGVEQASGEIVAIIEEHCLAKDDWLATIANSLTPEYVACGGPISDYNYARLRDWVTYFVEYNSSLPPWPDGATSFINGANLAYRRDALLANLPLLDHGYWEATVNPKLLAEGKKFRSVPAMTVYHRGPFDYFYYLRQRYLFSRAFSGARRASLSAGQRAAYLLAAPLVPFLLFARMGARVFEKKCRIGKFFASAALIFPALCVYTVGEWMGYAFGPGRALMEVE